MHILITEKQIVIVSASVAVFILISLWRLQNQPKSKKKFDHS